MEGIRFYRSSVSTEQLNEGPLVFRHGSIENSRCDFDLIFSLIYEFLSDKYLICDQIFLPDEEDESKLYSQMNRCIKAESDEAPVVFLGEVLKYYGCRMPEFDGNNVIVLNDLPDNLTIENSHFYQNVHYRDVLCILSNYDGLYWEIYSKDLEILDSLATEHKRHKFLDIYKVNYEMDYRDGPTRERSSLSLA